MWLVLIAAEIAACLCGMITASSACGRTRPHVPLSYPSNPTMTSRKGLPSFPLHNCIQEVRRNTRRVSSHHEQAAVPPRHPRGHPDALRMANPRRDSRPRDPSCDARGESPRQAERVFKTRYISIIEYTTDSQLATSISWRSPKRRRKLRPRDQVHLQVQHVA